VSAKRIWKKFLRKFQKPIDKSKARWYNIKVASRESVAQADRMKKTPKKFEKTLEKGLTNGKRSDIIYRLSARDRGQAKLLEN